MIYLAIALALAVAGVVALYRREVPRGAAVGFFAVALVAAISACVVSVPAGHVGVKVLFGDVQEGYLEEGLHLINPLLEVRDLSVRAQAYTMSGTVAEGDIKRDDSIAVLSKDGLQLRLDVTVTFKLLAEDAAWVYQKLGDDYVEKIIRPSVRTAIREAASEYESSLAYAEKRKELASQTETYLVSRLGEILQKTDKGKAGLKLKDDAFVIQQVLLRNVELPSRQRRAIEEKLAMQQEALRMEYVIQKEEKEKQRRKIEGEGIAQRMQIIKKELTPEYLRFKGIEATLELAESDNAKVVVIGSPESGLPVILDAE